LSLNGSPLGAAERPLLVTAAGEARLELATGEQVAVKLPAGGALETTAALGTGEAGWLAAGTQPAGAGRELLLLTGDGRTVSALPVPPGRTAALRQGPLPLVEGGRLAGLAWLEGQDRRAFAVRFAAWNGAGWEAPQTVAPPGPGSQLALAAARLADGSWLLAWSAFDGHDDEIVWSRGKDGAWSRPKRAAADNHVPDITPALTADGRGALLAWSRFDPPTGSYRVAVARFQGDRWTAPVTAGPAGSLFPTFEMSEKSAAGAPRLLYRTAEPAGWVAADLDTAGRVTRTAAVAATTGTRPAVADGADGAVFRWPGRTERTAAWKKAGAQ
jgi:hypothetical protein